MWQHLCPASWQSTVASVLRQTLEVSRWQGEGRERPSQSQLTIKQGKAWQASIQPANQISNQPSIHESIQPAIQLSFQPPNNPSSWPSRAFIVLVSSTSQSFEHPHTFLRAYQVYIFFLVFALLYVISFFLFFIPNWIRKFRRNCNGQNLIVEMVEKTQLIYIIHGMRFNDTT